MSGAKQKAANRHHHAVRYGNGAAKRNVVGRIGKTPPVALFARINRTRHGVRLRNLVFELCAIVLRGRYTNMVGRVGHAPYKAN